MEKKYNENGSNAAGGVCNMVLPTLMYFNPYKKKFASKYWRACSIIIFFTLSESWTKFHSITYVNMSQRKHTQLGR